MLNCFKGLLGVLAITSAVTAWADVITIQGSVKRAGLDIPLSADLAGKTLAIYVTAPSSEMQTLDLSVAGPDGTRIKAKGVVVPSSSNVLGLYSAGQSTALTLYPTSNYRATQSLSISSSSSSSSSGTPVPLIGGDPLCGCLPPEIIQVQQQLNPNFCHQFPTLNTCPTNNGGGGNNGTSAGPGVSASAFISTNKCISTAKLGAIIELDLSSVAASDLTSTIHVTSLFHEWDGNKRASIKPKSDGKFGPVPLLLAGQVYSSGIDPQVSLLAHRGTRLTRRTKIKINDNIYYKGNSYWRIVLNGVLRGGKGTFEMTSGAEGYSICAKLVKARQRFNGYSN